MRFKKMRAFSIVEVLISVACLSAILAMMVPAYNALFTRTDLNTSVFSLVSSFRRAQLLSQSANGDMGWGVRVATGSILIYKGSSYATRDVLYDETTTISSSIAISGISEVSFSKLYGTPSVVGTTTLTSPKNEIQNIIINQKGTVSY